MKIVVIYKSKYGTTETYARWIAEDLGADLLQANQVTATDLHTYDTIIYGGGLYAGGVNGIDKIKKNFDSIKEKSLFLFTVGATDMGNEENIRQIRSSIQNKFTPAMMEKFKIYHFRGAIKYSKMSFVDRNIIKLIVKMLQKKSKSELTEKEKNMLEFKGRDLDFADRSVITALVREVKNEYLPNEALSLE